MRGNFIPSNTWNKARVNNTEVCLLYTSNLGFDIKDYPNAYENYKSEITLPLHTLLTDEQVDFVIESLKAVSYTHLDVYKRQTIFCSLPFYTKEITDGVRGVGVYED